MVKNSGPILGLLPFFLALACSQPKPEPEPNPPDVLIVVLDTVRADHLSSYGYNRQTSPNFDRLAEQGLLFSNAWATSSWTAATHASLFTGLYPIGHGTTQESWTLSSSLDTAAEILGSHGFSSFAVVENPILAAGHGYAQGFAEYQQIWKKRSAMTTPAVFEEVLTRQDPEAPIFAFVNLIAAHSPYDPPEKFASRFLSDPAFELRGNDWAAYYRGERAFEPTALEHLRELYDAEILYVDDTLRQIVDAMARHRSLDNTILVITSDHGENFGEHGHIDHVFSLYETTLRVPLIIRYPAHLEAGLRIEAPAQISDVLPTILDLLGIEPSALELQGSSLVTGELGVDRVVFAEYYRPRQAFRAMRRRARDASMEPVRKFDRRLKTVIQNGRKLIWSSDGEHELYRLDQDPTELEDCVTEVTCEADLENLTELLNSTVEAFERRWQIEPPSPDEEADPDTTEALKALGYLQ